MTFLMTVLDQLEPGSNPVSIAILRLLVGVILTGSGVIVYRQRSYATFYPYLLLGNQIVIALIIALLIAIGDLNESVLLAAMIGLTLMYYQFIPNKYSFSLLASVVLGGLILAIGYSSAVISPNNLMIALILVVLLNVLGALTQRSLNFTRRREFLASLNLQQALGEREILIQDLQKALDEVQTLEAFLPICSSCHAIRNDEGYWERVEQYIQERTGTQFSHSLCPDCVQELYPSIYGNKS